MAKLLNLPWFIGYRLTSLYEKVIEEMYPFDRVYALSANPFDEFTPYQPERSWDTARCPENEFFCNENDRIYEQEIMIFLK